MGLGMADAIILRLSRSENCRIRPTGAVSKYAAADFDTLKAGKELGVDAVLEGTVQRVGERVRVTAMLWSLKDARPMWSGKFDEPFGDIFALQDSVSAQVADQLRLRIDSESPARRRYFPANVEAYRYYTMGYYFWTKRTKPNLAKAIQYFRRATETDPNYALAYASLTDAYLLDAYFGYDNLPLQEAYDNAKDAAARAVQIDDTLPEAQIAIGMVSEFEGDLKRAESLYGRAIELDPSSTTARLRYGHILASTSRLERAIFELRTASEIEPASPSIYATLGGYLLLARRYDESIECNKLALELDPEIYAAHENIAWAYAEQAMYGEAGAEFNTLTQIPVACDYGGAGMAYVAAKKGRVQEALQLLAPAKKKLGNGNGMLNPSLQIAMVLCQLGEKEEAFVWLERAVRAGRLQPYQLEYNAGLDSIRSDPRFGRMMDRARNARPPVKGMGRQPAPAT
jgi:tetratricopeptide (TPR) repeat protein